MQEPIISRSDILRLMEGDESAFDLLYRSYNTKVYRLAFRFLKDPAQSEEIVQETFLKLWLSRHRLDADGNIWLYLFVIAKRLSLNALKSVYKSADHLNNLLSNMQNIHNETEESILVADLERFTQTILSQLPKQQQTVFKMSRIDGLSHKEIAEKLAISPNTVKNHMVQALKTIKQQLENSDLLTVIILLDLFV